jgi:lipoprotein NlpI
LQTLAQRGDTIYPALWLRWLFGDARPIEAAAAEGWEAELRRHALAQIGDAELLRLAAEREPRAQRNGRACEAQTFISLAAEARGDRAAAVAAYRAAVAADAPEYVEDVFARFRLRMLESMR